MSELTPIQILQLCKLSQYCNEFSDYGVEHPSDILTLDDEDWEVGLIILLFSFLN